MRICFIGILTIFLFQIIYRQSKYIIGIPIKCRYATLDSLQGKWINTEDSLNQVIISGRNWNEIYNDATQPINENTRIFFSDTIVSVEDFRLAKIDTTALSGNYIIRVGMSDYSMDCNVIDGFYRDQSDTLFSIEPAIKKGTLSSLLFKKIQ